MGLVMRLLGLDTERRNYNLPLSQLDTWLDSIAASGVSGTGLLGLYGGLQSATGKIISEQTSLQCLAVFACVRVLSESIASMPLLTYRRLAAGGKERATNYPLYQKLHLQPNPEMSAMAYREAMVGHIELWGNHYSYVERDNGGRVLNLWPLRPDHMQSIRRNTETGKLEYLYHVPPDGESRILSTDEIMHIRGLSHSGVLGYSPIRQAREAVGLTQAGEEYGARFFGNFSGPSGLLQMDGTLTPDAAERLKKQWEEAHRGLTTAHRIAVLEAGVKWQQTGISPKDSQFLELRGFQLEEIAGRLFRVPLFMLGHTQPVTSWGSGIEQMSIGFVVFSLMPRLIRIEQQMSIDLLSPAERNTYFIAHLVDGLLRGDIKTRYEAYKIAIENGWMNQDEARELENLNPIPDGSGKNYWFMLNYAPLKKIAEMPMPENLPGTTRAQLEIIERDRRLALPPPERRDGEAKRRDLSGSLLPIFEDVISRIIRRERQDVMALADKHLNKRSVPDFDRAIEDFYREHTGFIARSLTPAFLSAGQAARDVAADEIDVAGGGDVFAFCYNREVPVSEFIDAYAANVAERWADGDLGQLQALTREALDTATDAREAVQTRLDAWVESTPSKLGREHSVELVQAVAVGLWAANGIRKLLWRTHGDNCPICTRMNGKIVEIGGFFVNKGDSLTDGEGKAWNFSRSFRHPPLHSACNCSVSPG